MPRFQKGHKVNLGRKCSEKTKRKIRKAKKGVKYLNRKNPPPFTEEHKGKLSSSHGGTGIPIRPNKRYYHLRDKKYLEWRAKVFARDNWTCQTCGVRSQAGEPVYLEPHHIKGWAKYPKLRYEVENGVTLCKECHKLTRKRY